MKKLHSLPLNRFLSIFQSKNNNCMANIQSNGYNNSITKLED